MSDETKLPLQTFFKMVYFSDIATSLIGVMIWGGFPYTNAIVVEMVNTCLMWLLFKAIVYFIIIFVIKYMSKYTTYAENILLSITVIYSIIVLNNLASLAIKIPFGNIDESFYSSLDANRIDFIP